MSNVHFQVFGHRFALQNGPLLDENYSARPLARMLTKDAPDVHTVAVYNVRRDMEYGLAFYLNRPMVNYELSGIPPQEHILVVRTAEVSSLDQVLMGRARKQMFVYPWQGLTVYRVAAQ